MWTGSCEVAASLNKRNVMFMYYRINLEVLKELSIRFPESLIQAHELAGEMLSTVVLESYDKRLLAEAMFVNGYMLGKHGKKINPEHYEETIVLGERK
jgi:hypothetical protein